MIDERKKEKNSVCSPENFPYRTNCFSFRRNETKRKNHCENQNEKKKFFVCLFIFFCLCIHHISRKYFIWYLNFSSSSMDCSHFIHNTYTVVVQE